MPLLPLLSVEPMLSMTTTNNDPAVDGPNALSPADSNEPGNSSSEFSNSLSQPTEGIAEPSEDRNGEGEETETTPVQPDEIEEVGSIFVKTIAKKTVRNLLKDQRASVGLGNGLPTNQKQTKGGVLRSKTTALLNHFCLRNAQLAVKNRAL
jgi:hypothetical protein